MKQEKLKVKTTVFEHFTKLTNENENVRLSGAYSLILHLQKNNEEKDINYAIKRLIRGSGSSTSNSRIGFYTALTGFLSAEIQNAPSIQEILEIMKKEFKDSSNDKGHVDSLVGIALVCGAIIRSEQALKSTSENDIEEIVKSLVSCCVKPSVAPVAYNFMAELVTKIDSAVIKSNVWPNLVKLLNITKDKITIDPVYLLLLIEDHHSDTIDSKFYKKNWQSDKILCKENLDVLANLLWKVDKINLINHPIYVYFMKRLEPLKLLKPFWSEHVEKIIAERSDKSKLVDIVTINAAISILKHLESSSKIIGLLTPNFLKIVQNQNSKLTKDEDFQEMYKELYELIDQRLQQLKNDSQKLQALRAFSELSIEKNSIKKFITNLINVLEKDGLFEAIEYIKSIIVSDQNEKERQYAASILQKIILTNKLVSNDLEWRVEQLKFFINISLLKSSNGVDIDDHENTITFSTNVKNIFYHSLEHKFAKIEDEKKVLYGLINHINYYMSKKDYEKFFQKPLEEKYCKIWTEMFSEINTKGEKKDKKLKTVFHVLMMHMALQLFNNPEVAENAISELVAVLQRVTKKKNQSENEPAWIEVVIDLFLTLLSQESYVLRNVIRHVFPQLCSQINVAAFNQILSMLDIRNKENPLQLIDGGDEEMSDQDDESLDNEEESMEIDDENGTYESDESDEGFSDIENGTLEDSDEDMAITNTVKMAVQKALGENPDEASDIDVDDISPEEGKKLNETLGSAFKLLMEHRNLKKKKKSKTVMMADKALLHFRMRLLDLVEIYLKNNPQMEICLDILILFFDLMPIAANHPEIKARFEKIFPQISQLKTFSLETVQNVTQKNLADIFNRVLEKTSIEKNNIQQQNYFKYTCVFIIYSSQILQKLSPDEDDEILKIILEHVRQFIKQRNPTLQVSTFIKILSTQWLGNFKVAKLISDEGLKPEVRSLRRTQSLQMLKEFFKNHHLFNQNEKKAAKYFGKISEHIKSYLSSLEEISQQEFFELIYFMMAAKNLKDFTAREELIQAIQKFRGRLILKQNILNAYRELCNNMKLEFISNDKIDPSKVKTSNEQQVTAVQNGTSKRKIVTINKKEKKVKKIKKLEETSEVVDASF